MSFGAYPSTGLYENVHELFADSFRSKKKKKRGGGESEEFVERFWFGILLEQAKQLPDWPVASLHLFVHI